MDLTLLTGYGFWNPLLWLAFLLIFGGISYFLWALKGNPACKPGTEQVKPFISGNPEPAKDLVHIRARHIYWGFVEGLQGYYSFARKMHTGDVRDYALWYLGVGVIILILLVGGI